MIRLLTALALLVALPAWADQFPEYYRVTGVAADDTLSVRSGPGARHEKIGDLGPNAVPVEVTAKNEAGTWARIAFYGDEGWGSTRYLEPFSPEVLAAGNRPTGIPVRLSCLSTEPFWDVTLENQTDVRVKLDLGPVVMKIREVYVAAGYQYLPAGFRTEGPNGTSARVSVASAECGDGMSDQTYAFSASIWMDMGNGEFLMHGCCTLRGALE